MIKMIVSDMDGTLLNQESEIPKANIEAINRAQKEGVIFAIASGRAKTEADPILEKANVTCPLITGNGAQGFDKDGTSLFTYDICKKETSKIINFLLTKDVYFEIATSNGVYSIDKEQRFEKAKLHLKSLKPNLTETELEALAAAHLDKLKVKIINDYSEIINDPEIKILKFIVISEKGQKILQPLGKEIKTFSDVLVTSSFENNIEINSVHATKGDAVKALAKHYNISLNDILVLGDNYNDVSMFEVAGYSAAMDNAVPELKDIATFISTHHTKDGVATAINHFLG